MKRMKRSITAALVLALGCIGISAQAQTQYRMNDRSMNQLMKRLETNADHFSNSVDRALDRSRLDGTAREDNINALVDEFEYETDQLRERYRDNEAIPSDAEAVLSRALRLEMFMDRHPLNAQAQRDWARVRTDLNDLARAYNVVWVWDVRSNSYMKNIPVRQVIQRIESRTDKFQNSLNVALDGSSLNGTKLEDEINALAQNLEKEADGLRDRADNRPGGGIVPADVESVLNRAMMIESFMEQHGNQLNARTRNDWWRVKTNMDELAQVYNVAWVWTIKVVPTTSSIR